MIGRALRVAAVSLVGLVLVLGCGSSDRPAELSVDEVKPCDLISRNSVQGVQIATESQKMNSVPGVDTEGNTCFYSARNGNTIYVSAITKHGIDRWGDPSFEHVRSEEVSRIQGYRTVKVWRDSERPGPDSKCKVYVDVAGGQSLRVQVDRSFEENDPPTCDTARRYAEVAMKTLVADRG
ncbi:DUF3558 family protein [Actinopolyspora halophila]|uniref:DUF3558 family protein n=1 Tax=Actinopolyspora halophila TaxID=1850 RepID=UPI00037949A0|nr:DUF3558 family protein [Actinopolyspora halophila]